MNFLKMNFSPAFTVSSDDECGLMALPRQ